MQPSTNNRFAKPLACNPSVWHHPISAEHYPGASLVYFSETDCFALDFFGTLVSVPSDWAWEQAYRAIIDGTSRCGPRTQLLILFDGRHTPEKEAEVSAALGVPPPPPLQAWERR